MTDQSTQKISRYSLAAIFFYHGLVPKLLFKSEQEVLMNNAFLPFMEKDFALTSSGIAEIIYALALVIFSTNKKLLYPAMAFSILATLAIIIQLPQLMTHAFNPFSINLAVFSLALIDLKSLDHSK
ncbi:DoxX-like family protein [Lentisphaera marina]|uniref:DoxX-like family protein n=1 Tax=Lentisphaera marina TaxID=1111041 RepID=UPI0023651FD2|nr:DoxX-like family protein [Lentisphaera marina]MDD7983426.1 DoxX-like family protein [Lentisphaera marina]